MRFLASPFFRAWHPAALDVYVPHIETPNSQTVWIAGQTANVTW